MSFHKDLICYWYLWQSYNCMKKHNKFIRILWGKKPVFFLNINHALFNIDNCCVNIAALIELINHVHEFMNLLTVSNQIRNRAGAKLIFWNWKSFSLKHGTWIFGELLRVFSGMGILNLQTFFKLFTNLGNLFTVTSLYLWLTCNL